MIGTALHRAAAVGLVGGDDVADEQVRFAGHSEAEIDPVLEFLVGAGLHHRHEDVFAEEAGVGRHLRRITPRIVADDHQRAALGMRAREISESQRVGGDVQADGFHRAHARGSGPFGSR